MSFLPHKKKEYVCKNKCKIKHCRHVECILVSIGTKERKCAACRMEENYKICSNRKCIVSLETKYIDAQYIAYERREEERMKDVIVSKSNAHLSITKTYRKHGSQYEYMNRRTRTRFLSDKEMSYEAWMKHLESKCYVVSFCYYKDLIFDYLAKRDEKNVIKYKFISFANESYTFDRLPYSDQDAHVNKKNNESNKHYKYRCVKNRWLNDEI